MAATPGIMWNPTHIQFSVLRARNLVSKGKNGTNDVFVCIQLGKEKYQTSVIKHTHHPEWFEECDMPIPHMHTEVQITLYHRGVLSDDFLGYTAIPLWEYKVYERPKSQWLQLQGRPGKSPDTKKRGEIEVRITFNVKSKSDTLPAGLVQSKKRSSIRNIATAVGDKLKGRSRSFRDNKDQHHESFVHRDLHPQHSSDSDTDSHSTLVASDDEDYHESHKPSTKVSTSSSSASSDENIPDFEKYKITRTVPNRPIRRKNPRGTIAPDSEKVGAMKKMDSSGADIVRSSSIPDNGLQSLGLDDDVAIKESRSKSLYLLPGDRWSQIELPPYTQNSPSRHSSSTTASSNDDPKDARHDTRHDTSYINGLLRRERDIQDNSENSHSDGYSRTQPDGDTGGLSPRSNRYSSEIESSDPETREPPIINKITDNNNVKDAQDLNDSLPANFRNLNKDRKNLYPDRPDSHSSHRDQPDNKSDIVNVRRRSKRDRARLYKLGGRRFTVQGFELHNPIQHDDALLDLSETARRSKRDIVPDDLVNVFRNMTKEELVRVVITHKAQLMRKDLYIKDLEKYIDNLLVRVMESTPKILQHGPRLEAESRRK